VETHLIWLARELTAQPDEDISYSWGFVVLADTYRDLCDACRRLTSRGSISGCLLLLQIWSWEYLPTSYPWAKKAYYPIPISNDIPDTMRPTMGYRWMFVRLRWMHQSDHGSYIHVVSDLDLLQIIQQNGMHSTITLVRTIPSHSDRVPRKLQDRERDSPQTTSCQRTSCIGSVADVVITSGWLSLCTNISSIIYYFVPMFL
jgi:hypothetical protein